MTVEEAVPAEVEGGREHLHVHPPVPSLPAGQVRQPSALTLEGDFYHVIDRKAAKIITDLRTGSEQNQENGTDLTSNLVN